MPSPTVVAAKSKRFFSCIVTLINKIFLAARNDGERGLGGLDKTPDTGHTTTDDNTGGWFHSQNILHLTFVGLVLIL